MEYIDNELLIFEVSKKEILYNKDHDEYDRANRQEAWMQVCKVLVENETSPDDWEKMDSERKTWICKQVTSRWKSLKDAFVKSIRRDKQNPRKKEYYYSRRMAFLLPYVKCNQTSENASENEEKEQTSQPSTSTEIVQFNKTESNGSVEWMDMPLAERLEAGDLLELELVEGTEGRNQATHETQPVLQNSYTLVENQQFIQPNFSTESPTFSVVMPVSPPKSQKLPEVMRIPSPKRKKTPEVKHIPSPKNQKVRGDLFKRKSFSAFGSQKRINQPVQPRIESVRSVEVPSNNLSTRSQSDFDADKLFLMSLLPDVTRLNDSAKLDFKVKVMQLLKASTSS